MTVPGTYSGQPLPDGWRWVRLGEVCEFEYGSGLIESARQEGAVPVYGSNGIVGYHNLPLTSGPTIVIGRKGSVGQVHYSPNPCFPIDTTYYIDKTRQPIDFSWFSYILSSLGLPELNKASGVPGLNRNDAYKLLLPFPPLSEQRRIARVLREQMAAVEKARAAAQVRLAASDALTSACLRAVFDTSEAATWPTKRLGEVLVPHKEIIHPGDRENGAATFVGLEHLEPHTGRRIGSLPFDLARLTGRKPTFRKGQIVYGYLRPYLNKVWIAEFDGCSSVDQFAYEVRSDIADVRFVAWFMRSPTYLRRSEVLTTTGQLPRIGTEQIAAVEIGLPPLDEQRVIADETDRRFATRQKLRDLLRDEADAIEKLPAALLRKVFEGKQ